MSDNLEKLFKRGVEGVSVHPPAHIWENIDSHFRAKSVRRRRLFLYSSAAAVIALLLFTTIFLTNNSRTTPIDNPLYMVEMISLTPNRIDVISTRESINKIPAYHKTTTSIHHSQQQYIEPLIVMDGVYDGVINQVDTILKLETPRGSLEIIPLTSKTGYISFNQYNKLLNSSTTESSHTTTTKKQHQRVAGNIKEDKKSSQLNYSLTGYISPGYTSGSYNLANKDSRINSYDEEQMSGIGNLNGGITFGINKNRLTLETGIEYTRTGQKTSDTRVYIPATYSDNFNNKTKVFTPLGNVKSHSMATVVASENEVIVSHGVRNDKAGTIEQQFDAIEIPLQIRYYLNNNRVLFSVLGGVGANILIGNETYLKYNNVKEKMGKTEDIRSVSMSTHIGIGIEYPITKSLKFRMEPGFKYYLQSISRDSDINFKPYSFNFSTGIGITF